MSAEEFVRRLARRSESTQYALLLGAGCSVSSGIPAAGALVRDHWLPRLEQYRKPGKVDIDEWAAGQIPGYDPDNPALSYGPVMEAVFPAAHDKRSEVERICRGRDPGFGFCVLAKLIERENPDLNVVLTTNFDDLVADSLYLFTNSRPLVIPHAALARFMLAHPGKTLVAKLHGDYQLEPLNTEVELAELNALVRDRLIRLLQQRGLIVIGYGGNDESVMGALEALPDDALGPGVWWVSRSHPNERVSNWLNKRGGRWVESASFDQLMLLVQQEFDLEHPEIDRWETVRNRYFEALSSLRIDVDKLTQSEPSATALKRASEDAIDAVSGWWSFELRARRLANADPHAADAIYREGIERLGSPDLMGAYAVFLKNVFRDYDRAEEMYRRALRLDPEDSTNTANYAIFLATIRREHRAAAALYEKALELDSRNETAASGYATMLTQTGQSPDYAEALYERALAVEPDDPNVLSNYAQHLILQGRASDAVAPIDRALKLVEGGDFPQDRRDVAVELRFYLYANGPASRRGGALRELKQLLDEGVRSPGWDLSGNVEQAAGSGHPEIEWLTPLAAVVADRAAIDSLARWDAWQAVD